MKEKETIAELCETLEELADLVEDYLAGEYIPDSYTTQAARRIIWNIRRQQNGN